MSIALTIAGFLAGYWLGRQVFITGCDDDLCSIEEK